MSTPIQTEARIPIELMSPASAERGSDPLLGTLIVRMWKGKDASRRARQITLKLLGRIFMVLPLGIFVHLLIPIVLIAGTLTLIASPAIYGYLVNQSATLSGAEGRCPSCQTENRLGPYLHRTLAKEVTLLCGACGQTCKALVKEA